MSGLYDYNEAVSSGIERDAIARLQAVPPSKSRARARPLATALRVRRFDRIASACDRVVELGAEIEL
jgi:hypothetical protein